MNKRQVWFTELFLWAVIILALILGFTYSFATSDQKNHSYYLFFKDVDGLSQGSPVRMMGCQIGYVKDVKVFKDNIFVSFLVTEKNIFIPLGSVARVEFYGLGGSKSLEIETPSKDGKIKPGQEILTEKPYRVSDYYKWGKQINTTVEVMATNTSSMVDAFVKQGVKTEFMASTAQKINSMLQSFIKSEDDIISKLNNKVNAFNNKYKNVKSTGNEDQADTLQLPLAPAEPKEIKK